MAAGDPRRSHGPSPLGEPRTRPRVAGSPPASCRSTGSTASSCWRRSVGHRSPGRCARSRPRRVALGLPVPATAVPAEVGETVVIEVHGDVERTWSVVRTATGWAFADVPAIPSSPGRLHHRQTWRLLTNNLPPAELEGLDITGAAAARRRPAPHRAIIGEPARRLTRACAVGAQLVRRVLDRRRRVRAPGFTSAGNRHGGRRGRRRRRQRRRGSARIDSADAGGGMTAERPAQMSGLDTTDATVAAALDARPSVPATT